MKKTTKLPKFNIKHCKECKGKPEESGFELEDFIGIKCETCYKVISYERKTRGAVTRSNKDGAGVFNLQKVKAQGI